MNVVMEKEGEYSEEGKTHIVASAALKSSALC